MSRNNVRTLKQAEAYARWLRVQSLFRRSDPTQHNLVRFWNALVEGLTAEVADEELLREWAGL